MLKKVIPVDDAIAVVHDGDVLATTGYGGHGIPEQLLVTLEQRFLQTGTPRGLTLVHSTKVFETRHDADHAQGT